MKFLTLVSLYFLVFSGTSFAQDLESPYFLANSEGISKPGTVTALRENPAGLVLNKRTKLVGEMFSPEKNFTPKTMSAGIITGANSIGWGILYSKIDSLNTGQLATGLGLGMSDVDISFGATGYADTNFNNKNVDVGLLFNGRRGDISFGFTGYQLIGGANKLGGGMTYRIDRASLFSVDVTGDKNLHGKIVKPAFEITNSPLQISVGYGFETDKKTAPSSAKGFGSGAGLEIGRLLSFFAFYNHISKYYAGLALKF